MRESFIFVFLLFGFMLLIDISLLPSIGTLGRIRQAAKNLAAAPKKLQRTNLARDYVLNLNGKQKENLFHSSRRRALETYKETGQEARYKKTLKLSLFLAIVGASFGLIIENLPLSIVLACGLYFIPLWLSKFSLYRYDKFLADELEVALSLITTSYTRTNDIASAMEENMKHINRPVRDVFQAFVNNIKFVDPNVPTQIELMKHALDNSIYHQWCDALLLCQSDYTLSSSLMPIVNKFAVLKQQRIENETKMMMPLRQSIGMTSLIAGLIPGMRIINLDWYTNVMYTMPGQVVITLTAICVFVTINKSIELCQPIEIDL